MLRTEQCISTNKNNNKKSKTSHVCIQGASVCKLHRRRCASVGLAMQRLMQPMQGSGPEELVTERVQRWLRGTAWHCLPGFSLALLRGMNPVFFSSFFLPLYISPSFPAAGISKPAVKELLQIKTWMFYSRAISSTAQYLKENCNVYKFDVNKLGDGEQSILFPVPTE